MVQTSMFELSGGLVGGTVGCNYQVNSWVVGLEDDFSWTNKKGTSPLIAPFNTSETAQTSESWLSTTRGRLGFAWNRWLVYGTGGAAIAKEGFQLCDPVTGCAGQSKVTAGWTAGAGVEYAFMGAWSGKVEYLHVDLGTVGYGVTTFPGGLFAARNVRLTDDIFRVGVNYKFGWAGR
jgi:outer membrane immunogenic protein